MSLTITLKGNPPSGNHAYDIGRARARDGREFAQIVKKKTVRVYQDGAIYEARDQYNKSGWRWHGGQVICEYRLFLSRDADCTNVIKVCEDAIFPALGINDSYALPRAMSKEIVSKADARVEVTIEEVNP